MSTDNNIEIDDKPSPHVSELVSSFQRGHSASGAKFRNGWSTMPKVHRPNTSYAPVTAEHTQDEEFVGASSVATAAPIAKSTDAITDQQSKDEARAERQKVALIQYVNRAAEKKRMLEEKAAREAAEADENKAADVKSLDDEILAKRKENQRLEEERIELEQKLSEKRKESDALKARAPTTTPVPIIADINDNFSMGNADDMGKAEEGIAGDPTSHTSMAKDDENDDDSDTQPQHKPLWRQKHCIYASLLLLLAIVGGAIGIVIGVGKKDASSSATDTNAVAIISISNNTDAPTLAPVSQYPDGEQIGTNTFDPTLAPNVDKEINYDGIPTYTTTPTTHVSREETSMKPTTNAPSTKPTPSPSNQPPTRLPVTAKPTPNPTKKPVTDSPNQKPTNLPLTNEPSKNPTKKPIMSVQSENPTKRPATSSPVTADPTHNSTKKPVTNSPTKQPGSVESFISMPVVVDRTCYYNKKQDVYVSAVPNFVSQEMLGGASRFDGNTALVTQYDEQSAAWGAGAVWILSKVNGIWEVTTALQSSETEQFGWGLSIKGDDMIAIGSPGYEGITTFDSFLNMFWYGRGRVNVLRKDGGAWYQEATLSPVDADEKAGFGASLDIADCKCLMAVGAWNDRDTRGSTYIYSRFSNGSWAEIQKLAPSSTSRSESFTFHGNFGHSVAFSKNAKFLAVQAPYDYLDGQRGVVYMYRAKTDANGSQQYDEFDRLSTPEGVDISYRSLHGTNVVFLDGHLLVGSPGNDKVYVFTQNSLGLYRKSAELIASDYGAESLFGVSIDGEGTQAIIGSYSLFDEQPVSYLFSLEGNSWVEKAKFDGGASLSGNAIMHVNNNFGVDFSIDTIGGFIYGGDVSFYDLECER